MPIPIVAGDLMFDLDERLKLAWVCSMIRGVRGLYRQNFMFVLQTNELNGICGWKLIVDSSAIMQSRSTSSKLNVSKWDMICRSGWC